MLMLVCSKHLAWMFVTPGSFIINNRPTADLQPQQQHQASLLWCAATKAVVTLDA